MFMSFKIINKHFNVACNQILYAVVDNISNDKNRFVKVVNKEEASSFN